MADSTTFHDGPDFGLFVAEALETRRPRTAERVNINSLRDRVREIGLDLKRNWSEGAQGAARIETRPIRPAPQDHPVAPPPAEVARELQVQPEPQIQSKPQAAPNLWAEQLAEEYCQEFILTPPAAPSAPAPAAMAVAPAIEDKEEPVAWAERAYAAGAAIFVFGRALGSVLGPVAGLAIARGGLLLRLLLLAVVGLAVLGLLRDWPASAPAPAPTVHPAWIDISKPYPLFELSAPGFGREATTYAARRHAPGGGREDTLTFGEFAGKKPYLRFSVYRHGAEEAAKAVYFVDMARRAGAAGTQRDRGRSAQALPTRFGIFESAPLQLSGPSGARKNCRGFRAEIAQPALTFGGLACGAEGEPVTAGALACAIDRLDLLAAGEDRALADFFGAAQGKSARACAEAGKRK